MNSMFYLFLLWISFFFITVIIILCLYEWVTSTTHTIKLAFLFSICYSLLLIFLSFNIAVQMYRYHLSLLFVPLKWWSGEYEDEHRTKLLFFQFRLFFLWNFFFIKKRNPAVCITKLRLNPLVFIERKM